MKNRFGLVLWASYILTMAASIGHLAWTFGTLEPAGFQWAGWLPALAVDAGLAALAYAIQQRKRAGRGARSLWGGVAVFSGISAYANTLHALSIAPAELWKALALSAVLPLLVVYLGEIISADDAAAADAAQASARKAEADAERSRMRAEREAERALALAQAEAARIHAEAAAQAAHDAPAQVVDAAALRSAAARTAARARWDAKRAASSSAGPANGVAHQ